MDEKESSPASSPSSSPQQQTLLREQLQLDLQRSQDLIQQQLQQQQSQKRQERGGGRHHHHHHHDPVAAGDEGFGTYNNHARAYYVDDEDEEDGEHQQHSFTYAREDSNERDAFEMRQQDATGSNASPFTRQQHEDDKSSEFVMERYRAVMLEQILSSYNKKQTQQQQQQQSQPGQHSSQQHETAGDEHATARKLMTSATSGRKPRIDQHKTSTDEKDASDQHPSHEHPAVVAEGSKKSTRRRNSAQSNGSSASSGSASSGSGSGSGANSRSSTPAAHDKENHHHPHDHHHGSSGFKRSGSRGSSVSSNGSSDDSRHHSHHHSGHSSNRQGSRNSSMASNTSSTTSGHFYYSTSTNSSRAAANALTGAVSDSFTALAEYGVSAEVFEAVTQIESYLQQVNLPATAHAAPSVASADATAASQQQQPPPSTSSSAEDPSMTTAPTTNANTSNPVTIEGARFHTPMDKLKILRVLRCKKTMEATKRACIRYAQTIDRFGLALLQPADVRDIMNLGIFSTLSDATALDGTGVFYVMAHRLTRRRDRKQRPVDRNSLIRAALFTLEQSQFDHFTFVFDLCGDVGPIDLKAQSDLLEETKECLGAGGYPISVKRILIFRSQNALNQLVIQALKLKYLPPKLRDRCVMVKTLADHLPVGLISSELVAFYAACQ